MVVEEEDYSFEGESHSIITSGNCVGIFGVFFLLFVSWEVVRWLVFAQENDPVCVFVRSCTEALFVGRVKICLEIVFLDRFVPD